jgi:Uncharacterized protein conserved in bacteria (DUF2252)
MSVVRAIHAYETWLDHHIQTDATGRAQRHQRMRANAFAFLRATYPRWLAQWRRRAGALADAPVVLAVGDLHVENFGTCCDAEGRLAWGVNDVDEAAPLAYVADLVRLCASAILAAESGHLALAPDRISTAIVNGYQAGLASGGKPLLLAVADAPFPVGQHGSFGDPVAFAADISRLQAARPPAAVTALLRSALPAGTGPVRFARRRAGLGSRDHDRFVAVTDWCGGAIVREAKELAPPATAFLDDAPAAPGEYIKRILAAAIRAPDPSLRVAAGWLVRRLAPDCDRVELSDLPQTRDEQALLHAMGVETANVHLPSADVEQVTRHLKRLGAGGVAAAAEQMLRGVRDDWHAYRDHTDAA